MSQRIPLAVLLAGPNGAGKSTGAPYLLRGTLAVDEFVNADVIARGLSAYRPEGAAIQAGRVMLERLQFLAASRRDFAFETTLSGRGPARWVRGLRDDGYRVHLIFLALNSAEVALARVAQRVRRGGHHGPEEVVKRRFRTGLDNLFSLYLDAVDSWQLYENSEMGGPRLIASKALGTPAEIMDQDTWRRMQEGRA